MRLAEHAAGRLLPSVQSLLWLAKRSGPREQKANGARGVAWAVVGEVVDLFRHKRSQQGAERLVFAVSWPARLMNRSAGI